MYSRTCSRCKLHTRKLWKGKCFCDVVWMFRRKALFHIQFSVFSYGIMSIQTTIAFNQCKDEYSGTSSNPSAWEGESCSSQVSLVPAVRDLIFEILSLLQSQTHATMLCLGGGVFIPLWLVVTDIFQWHRPVSTQHKMLQTENMKLTVHNQW